MAEPGSHEPRTTLVLSALSGPMPGPGRRTSLLLGWTFRLLGTFHSVSRQSDVLSVSAAGLVGTRAHEDVIGNRVPWKAQELAPHPADNTTGFLWHQTVYKSNISAACLDMQW